MLLSKTFFQLQCSGEKVQTYGNWRNFSKDREHLEFLFTNSTLAKQTRLFLFANGHPKLLFHVSSHWVHFQGAFWHGGNKCTTFFSKNSVFTTGFITHICLKSTWRLGVGGWHLPKWIAPIVGYRSEEAAVSQLTVLLIIFTATLALAPQMNNLNEQALSVRLKLPLSLSVEWGLCCSISVQGTSNTEL